MIYGDLNDAEVYFQKCLLEKETEAGAYYNLAKIAMLKGDKDKALQYVNIAIETDNKYSKIADEEPVFIPIKVAIRFNYDEVKNEEPENLTENEIRVRKYLDRTYYVSGDISKKDLYLARASKEDIENARREKLEKGFEQDEEYSEDFENEIDTNDEIKEEKNEIEEQKEKEE